MTPEQASLPNPPARGRFFAALSDDRRYRIGVALRALAAIAGGYGVAALAAAMLAVSLPMARAEAVVTATLVSYVIYAVAVMWVFAARSVLRACAGLLIAALPFAAGLLVYRFVGN